jgi:hypothetical protein
MKITLQKRLGRSLNKLSDNSKEKRSNSFKKVVEMHQSRSVHQNSREYCTYVNEGMLYDLLLEYRPTVLFDGKRIITKTEFKEFINSYTLAVKEIVINGMPIKLAYVGAIGIEIYQKKAQLPKSRNKPWKEKQFVELPDYRIMQTTSINPLKYNPLSQLSRLSIEFTNNSKKEIINRYLNEKRTYSLTSKFMYRLAKTIKNGSY